MSNRYARHDRRVLVVPGRGFVAALLSLLLIALSVSLTPAQAADPAAGSDAGDQPKAAEVPAAAPGASPWEHELWTGATTMMRIYVCSHARRHPSWCQEEQQLPSQAPLPEEQGPPLTAEDAAWLTFLERTDPAKLTAKDVAVIMQRATVRRDPQAMEILGFLYAQGASVERDYAEAYRWYGRAYLAGERGVRANMDIVWSLLQRHDLESALALTREFNALAKGQQPPTTRGAEDANAASASSRDSGAATADPTGL